MSKFKLGDKVRYKPNGNVFTINGKTERGLYICEPFAIFPYYTLELLKQNNNGNQD